MKKPKSGKRKRPASASEVIVPKKVTRCHEQASLPEADKDEASYSRAPPLPTELPLVTQHNLLQHVQHLLEDMCLGYGKRWCWDEMQKRGWIESRSLELQCWVHFIRRHAKRLPPEAPSLQPSSSESDLFTKVVKIRHLGVHRRSLDLSTILQFLTAAEKFAKLHQDLATYAKISHITSYLQTVHDDLIMWQDNVRDDLQRQIDGIRLQQAALENQAKAEVGELNRQYLTEMGDKIGGLLGSELQNEDRQSLWTESLFDESSDIDEILMEAAALMAKGEEIDN